MQNENTYHIPVLLKESVDGLVTNPNGIYLDLTFGGGGHSREILSRLEEDGRLFGLDQDIETLKNELVYGEIAEAPTPVKEKSVNKKEKNIKKIPPIHIFSQSDYPIWN